AEPESKSCVGNQGSAADAVDLSPVCGGATILQTMVRLGRALATRAREAGRRHAEASSRRRAPLRAASDHQRRRRRLEQKNHERQTQSRWLSQPIELHDRDLFPLRRAGFIPTLIPDGSLKKSHLATGYFQGARAQSFETDVALAVYQRVRQER